MSTNTERKTGTPAVSCVSGDTIVELVLNPSTNETAFAVARGGLWDITKEVRLGKETLVPYSATNNLIAHRCVLLPSEPVDHVGKEALLADVQAFLHRYVDLTPAFERIASYYVLLSWLYDAFAEVPYLRLRGDFGTGKTRGLIAIGALCYKPFFAAGASTVSPIFHTLDRFAGTLVLDEADMRFSDATAELVKIFNNGTVKGLPVLRSVQNKDKEFNPAAFHVFGPKIIAMRGSFEDDALESRFITEETGGKSLRSDIPVNVPDSLHAEALLLRNRLLHFRFCVLSRTKPSSEHASADLDPRLNQIGLPLLSLADNPHDRALITKALLDQQHKTRERKAVTIEGIVLSALIELLPENASPSVQDVTDRTNVALEKSGQGLVSPRRVGAILRGPLQLSPRKSHGIYLVEPEQERLDNLAKRFGVSG